MGSQDLGRAEVPQTLSLLAGLGRGDNHRFGGESADGVDQGSVGSALKQGIRNGADHHPGVVQPEVMEGVRAREIAKTAGDAFVRQAREVFGIKVDD